MKTKYTSYALLTLIALFSLTTIGNVAYFVEKLHSGFVGYTLGGALGTALFLTAFIAATAESHETRKISLICAILFGLTSAYFQFSVYAEHAETAKETFNAFLLAFVPIVVGEAGLALLESSIAKEKEKEEAYTKLLLETIEKLKRESEEISSQLSAEIRKKMDAEKHVESLKEEISRQEISSEKEEISSEKEEISRPKKVSSSGKLPKKERIPQVWKILTSDYIGKEKEEIDKEELARKFNVSTKTISNDLDELWEKQNLNGVVKT